MAGSACDIVDLRVDRRFSDVVAERIWTTWWAPYGAALSDVKAALDECLAPGNLPFTLVAREGERFLGTVSGVVCDLEARPRLSPWIAALWVEPEERRSGVGSGLMRAAEARFAELGNSHVFLCARPSLRDYYDRWKWQRIDEAVGPDALDVWRRETAPADALATLP